VVVGEGKNKPMTEEVRMDTFWLGTISDLTQESVFKFLWSLPPCLSLPFFTFSAFF
jgi:hypothetical protein